MPRKSKEQLDAEAKAAEELAAKETAEAKAAEEAAAKEAAEAAAKEAAEAAKAEEAAAKAIEDAEAVDDSDPINETGKIKNLLKNRLRIAGSVISPGDSLTLTDDQMQDSGLIKVIRHQVDIGSVCWE